MKKDNLTPSEIVDILSDNIFAIRSDRIVTIITNDCEKQILLPKFIKRNNLNDKKEELSSALKSAVELKEACIVVNTISKISNKIAGLYVLKDKIVFIPSKDIEKFCKPSEDENVVYVNCQEMFA